MGNDLHGFQTTVKDRVTLSGFGVHSGSPVSVTFLPADANTVSYFRKLPASKTAERFALYLQK